jgi:aspartyl-tRNA synthetase
MCGEVRAEHVGKRVTLAGWADTRRDHGGLVFVDLRDWTGICQLVMNPESAPEATEVAHTVRNEFVLRAVGEVVRRSAEAVNPNLPTGEIEVQVDELEVLARCPPLPFQLDEEGVEEGTRLRYRWLDLRRERMQRNLRLSATVVGAIRRRMEELGFVDLWTPSLTKGTPEGARDFLVPVRLQPGRFFALAQSPQLFKQLFMISGFDRYYQIVTCYRDEDLRADRQFEFRQLDLEMAFAQREDVLEVLEEAVVASFEALGREPPARPFPRLSWAEAMARYGSDKPDLRFDLEIRDGTEVTRGSQFGVFAGAPAVRYLTVPQAFSRAELATLEEHAKEWGGKGLAYLVWDEGGEVRSPIAKFLSEDELAAFRGDPGSTTLFGADEPATVARVLGALRAHLGRELGLADGSRDAFTWIIDFPLFEWDTETQLWTAAQATRTPSGPTRAPSSARRTTSSGTAGSSARARSASTRRTSRDRSSGRSASPRTRLARSSASSSRRCEWERRRTAALRWAWTAFSPCSRESPISAR